MKIQRLFTVMAALSAMMIHLFGMKPVASAAELRSHRATGIPDYFNTPNYAYSPPLRKFVDTLPGLGSANQNNLGQYIPVGIPDTTTYPGSDYYEIEMGQFREQMHGDLPAVSPDETSGGTLLRGYRQTNATGPGAAAVNQFHFLGPIIIAQKNRPVRVKFTNKMPTGVAGNLFVPVDTTIMGSGEFEINYDPETKQPIPMTLQDRNQLKGPKDQPVTHGSSHTYEQATVATPARLPAGHNTARNHLGM